MYLQQRQVFTGKCPLPMMLLLITDVVPQSRIVRATHCECAISMLPLEITPVREALVNPSCGAGFDAADELRNADRGWRFNIEMYVITDAAGTEKPAILTLDDCVRAGE